LKILARVNMIYVDIINLVIGVSIFTFLIWGAFVSYKENEIRAMYRMLFISFLAPVPFLFPALHHFSFWHEYSLLLWSFSGLVFIILFFPINRKTSKREIPKSRIDERDIIFSKRKLKTGTDRYNEYYSAKPQMENVDNKWRKKPGLLQKDSKYFNAYQFAVAEANFETVNQFKKFITGKPANEVIEVNPKDISEFIKNWSIKIGAIDCGITTLKDYHLYSLKGYDDMYSEPVNNNHKYAIAFVAEMDKGMIDSAPKGSAVMESAQQYLNLGTVAVQVASFIRNLGHDASAHIDGNYQVICPLVARDAGLGEIGRMGLLKTPKLGPRVRISVVTTDLPLIVDESKNDGSVTDFCNICEKCADACPSGAIPRGARTEIEGVKRWQIDQEACFSIWCSFGTDCARCMAVCPYSHPNNLFHNIVRFGIKHFPNFRRPALLMDDFFYGRKPESKKMLDWMEI